MSTYQSEALDWEDPLLFAQRFCSSVCVLLYSGMHTPYSGRYSLFAHTPSVQLAGGHFSELKPHLTAKAGIYDNAWFGYLGYELLHDLETIAPAPPSFIPLPRFWMAQFAHIFLFDHEAKTLMHYSAPGAKRDKPAPGHSERAQTAAIASLHSNMTRAEYLSKAGTILNAIHAGDFYQANLTRKFHGTFERVPDSFILFKRLCEASPAPYAAFINTGKQQIISSSPERFLQVDDGGRVESRPIKGTMARRNELEADAVGRARLMGSEKDRAENLMIVDLMRNDLARGCVPGSVKVENLFEVATYATLHHMDSTIIGQKHPDVSTLELVKQCFPPGSMTGAPKIRAMQTCAMLEGMERGVYSGALGWFGGDGSCDLSVVIRTLVVEGGRFEFQVGGGIVAESEPQAEWRETLTKARGICAALGIDIKKLEAL